MHFNRDLMGGRQAWAIQAIGHRDNHRVLYGNRHARHGFAILRGVRGHNDIAARRHVSRQMRVHRDYRKRPDQEDTPHNCRRWYDPAQINHPHAPILGHHEHGARC